MSEYTAEAVCSHCYNKHTHKCQRPSICAGVLQFEGLLGVINEFAQTFIRSVALVDGEVVVNPNEAAIVMPFVEEFVNHLLRQGLIEVK